METTTSKLFKSFLINHGIFHSFVTEMQKKTPNTNFVNFCVFNRKPQFIYDAFAWHKTAHGYDFWESMHWEWKAVVQKYYSTESK